MKNMLCLSLVAASFLVLNSGCAAPEDSEDANGTETESPAVVGSDGLTPNMMKNPPLTKYTPRVTRADILAGGGSCASSLCTLGPYTYQCSGSGTCTYLGTGT